MTFVGGLREKRNIHLSTRQAETLAYLFDGLNPKMIARKLGVSHRTIDSFIEQIKLILSVQYKADIIKKAKEFGFDHIYKVIMAKMGEKTKKTKF